MIRKNIIYLLLSFYIETKEALWKLVELNISFSLQSMN